MVCWSHSLIQAEAYLWLKACKINVLGGGLICMKATWVHIKKRKDRTGLHSHKTHLLLEISNCVFICVGEEVQDVVFYVVFLQVVHQVCSIALRASQHADKYIRFWTKESPTFHWEILATLGVCITSVIPTPWVLVLVLEFLNFENEPKNSKSLDQDTIITWKHKFLALRKEYTKATSCSFTPRGYRLNINKEVSGVNIDHEFLLMLRVFENLRSKEQWKWEGLTFSRILTNPSVSYIQQISNPSKELYHHTQRIFNLVFSDLSQQSLRSPEALSETKNSDSGWDGWTASPIRWTWIWATLGDGEGQGGLVCCSPWGHEELDVT